VKTKNIKSKNYRGYQISVDGTIIGKRGYEIGSILENGYKQISISLGKGEREDWRAHRLVATLFIPNPKCLPEVNHIDGDKLNNKVSNLEWCTHKENIRHAEETGLRDSKGSKNSKSKLTEKDVVQIRRLLYETNLRQNQIAERFGVGPMIISNIKNGKNWSHI